jgi:hypothetical protein
MKTSNYPKAIGINQINGNLNVSKPNRSSDRIFDTLGNLWFNVSLISFFKDLFLNFSKKQTISSHQIKDSKIE